MAEPLALEAAPPAAEPAVPSPWDYMRKLWPGAILTRYIDREAGSDIFLRAYKPDIGPMDRDGRTYHQPPIDGLAHEEILAIERAADVRFWQRRGGAGVTLA